MKDKRLKGGDTVVIPKGWTIEVNNSEVAVYGPGCTASDAPSSSRRGFSFYEFFDSLEKVQPGDATSDPKG